MLPPSLPARYGAQKLRSHSQIRVWRSQKQTHQQTKTAMASRKVCACAFLGLPQVSWAPPSRGSRSDGKQFFSDCGLHFPEGSEAGDSELNTALTVLTSGRGGGVPGKLGSSTPDCPQVGATVRGPACGERQEPAGCRSGLSLA
uniref:Uncharacterized protein n=1 Tax=Myotis myotis TaxID=51298 RepID=A0A7J7SC23_MYOMY|nr:hypothetical protein mMyoMyo1_009472 [Myotis myotis]